MLIIEQKVTAALETSRTLNSVMESPFIQPIAIEYYVELLDKKINHIEIELKRLD